MSNRLVWSRVAIALLTVTLLVAARPRIAGAGACPMGTYTVSPTAPASANWTDDTGALWVPSGSFPGAGTCDAALNAGTSNTITVDTVIPNPVHTLNFNCVGCVIDIQPGGHLTVDSFGALLGSAAIRINGGTLTINVPSANGGFTLGSGTSIELNSGTLSGTGVINVGANGALVLADGTVDGITINNSGTVALLGAGTTVSMQNGATINNNNFINVGSGTVASSASGPITNNGLVEVAGGGIATINPVLDNVSGTGVLVNSGHLIVAGGGTGNAPFSISSDQALEFSANTYTLGAGGTISGAGTLIVSGATLSIGGVTDPANFLMTGGTLTGAGFLSIGGTFDWQGGTITGGGGAELAGTGLGTFSGAAGPMFLDGRTLNIYGTADYTATTDFLQLSNGAVLGVYGTFNITDDGSIDCDCSTPSLFLVSPNGVVTKTGGAGTSVIGALVQNDSQMTVQSGILELSEDGFHNGAFYAATGTTLRFTGSNNLFDTASSVSADGTIEFVGGGSVIVGTYNVAGATVIDGAGVFLITGGQTVDFSLIGGGLLALDAPFQMTGTGTWSDGTIADSGSGLFTVAGGATLTIDAATCVPTLDGIELVNDGTILYTPTAVSTNHLQMAGATITNNGIFDMQADAPISIASIVVDAAAVKSDGCSSAARKRMPVRSDGLFFDPSFIVNNGTWKKTGAGTSDIEPAFTNNGTVLAQAGVMNFTASFAQNSGTTTLGPGDIEVNGTMQLSGGTLDGAGTVTGDVQNDATVAPGNGTTGVINVTGNYTQGSTGTLAIGIGGPSVGQFDQLAVTGTSTLAGAFTASLLNAYVPVSGTTWNVLTYASNTGTFASETLPPFITSSYTANAFVLQAVNPSVDLGTDVVGPPSVNAGAPLSYTVTITNNGPNATSGTVTVNHTLPAGVTGATGTGTGWTCNPPAGGVIQCSTTASVANAASFPVLTINMTAPANGGGSITKSATVTSSFDTNGANDSDSVNTTVVSQADLQITKNGPNGVTAGQNIVYTISVTNNGPSTASGVTVTDPDPANATFVSNSGACVTAFPCSLGVLSAGQTVTITSTYSTSPSFSGNVTNTATVSSSTTDPNGTNDSSTKVTNVGAQADLQITKTGPASTTPGQDVVYTITFLNNGPSPATGVVVSDPTPPGTAWFSNTGACTTAFPCNIGTLAAGQSGTITATFTVPANYTGTSISNTASISSPVNDPNTANNASTVITNVAQSADVAVVKSGPATITPGQNIVYTVTVTNNGPSSAGSVVVTDPDPAGTTFVSNTGACTTAYPCNLGTLVSGQSVTITSTYNVPSNYGAASVVNTATVTSGASDGNGANNSSTVTTAVLAQADLAITKTGPASVNAGSNVVYTITVTNAGPLPATNTFVTDATPPGLTFVSNTGACTTAFPCALGTINAGQTVTITSTFHVPAGFAGPSATNTASVSTSTFEANLANNSSSVTTTVTPATLTADVAITKTGPGGARQFDILNFTITVTNHGPATATNVVVNDPPPAGMTWISNSGACTTNFPCNLGTMSAGQTATITATYRFASVSGSVTNTATVTSSPADPNTANNTSSVNIAAGPVVTCPTGGPALLAPGNNVTLTPTGNVNFSWTSMQNAIGYFLTINRPGGQPPLVLNTGGTTASVALPPGAYSWNVSAAGAESCRPIPSVTFSFLICATLTNAPIASVVGESTTGQTYAVEWPVIEGATSYEIQESLSPAFTDVVSSTIVENGKSFTKTATAPTAYWYRVRALASCNPTPGPFSIAIAVVVVPVPTATNRDPNVNVPDGSHTPVTWTMFVPGLPEGTTSFVATVDKPWLSVTPTSGIIPPAGMNFTVAADPSTLTNGTWTGTLIVVYGTTSVSSRLASDETKKYTAPISISLVTPVTPTALTAASNTAMVVPSVGHLAGVESLWRSDIRLANLAPAAQKFQLVFNPGTGGGVTATKTTTITVDSGVTTALDDIVRNWYGIGSLGNSSNGLLTVQPLDAAGRPLTGISNVSAVSSRTFNANSTGTFGQFIPAVPFSKFIGRSGGGAASSMLSLQQLAQNASYRTNLGIVEASGRAANVLVSAFDENGGKLFDLPVTLQAGEQKLLNGVLSANGISSLENGRIEVRVTGGDGKVTAYASVVDNVSSDPILISGTAVDAIGANRFVVPGIADFTGGGSNWRSDMRVFNSGATPQTATLTFYPSDNRAPVTAQVSVAPGEVEQLDDVLHSVLGVTNLGGALHVTTPSNAPLVVTARTYDQTSKGTLGQFIPAVTTNEAVGLADRSLQILQAEESGRYRTNIGVAEVTGKAAIAEISVHLADSKVTPVLQIPLNAFESRQIPVLSSLGLGNVYNARVSVRVVGGDGRVTAYGSVIDNATKDPTFIPAQ
jgi:uncharacterized repeat protein (TIGR01451 family)